MPPVSHLVVTSQGSNLFEPQFLPLEAGTNNNIHNIVFLKVNILKYLEHGLAYSN